MDFSTYSNEKIDIHHIFPKAYCTKENLDKRKWNSILNKTPLFFVTNRYIGGSAPSEYIHRMIKKKEIAETELQDFIESHLISFELLKENLFDEFIKERAIQILNKIEEVTGKKITDRASEEVIDYFGEPLIRK